MYTIANDHRAEDIGIAARRGETVVLIEIFFRRIFQLKYQKIT